MNVMTAALKTDSSSTILSKSIKIFLIPMLLLLLNTIMANPYLSIRQNTPLYPAKNNNATRLFKQNTK